MNKNKKNILRMIIGFIITLLSMYMYDLGEEIITGPTGVIIRRSLISYGYAIPFLYGFALTVKGGYKLFGKKLLESLILKAH